LYHFFFTHTATTEIYTLSLHDALPILVVGEDPVSRPRGDGVASGRAHPLHDQVERLVPGGAPPAVAARRAQHRIEQAPGVVENLDRKSTRLNSSHVAISYAVFCLKKKR